jgi:hypothetical protein
MLSIKRAALVLLILRETTQPEQTTFPGSLLVTILTPLFALGEDTGQFG